MAQEIDLNDAFAQQVLARVGPQPRLGPRVFFNSDGDCIELLLSNDSYRAQRLDSLVTVYVNRENGDLVGALVKGVSRFIAEMVELRPRLQDRNHRRQGAARVSVYGRALEARRIREPHSRKNLPEASTSSRRRQPRSSTRLRLAARNPMIVTTKQLFAHAYGRYAVGAYNINNLEQTVGLFRGNLGKSKLERRPGQPGHQRPVHPANFPRGPRAIPTSGSWRR